MTPQIIIGDSAFEQLSGEWDHLAGHSMTDTPFQWLAYQKSWWTHLQPANSTLITIAVRNDAGTLQGIGCFYNIDGVLYFNGCVEETDYLDLIAPADQAPAVWQSVFDCLTDAEMPPWETLSLCNVPAKSPSRVILAEICDQRDFSLYEEPLEVCPVIRLPESFEAYLETLDSKQRREISRKLRRAEAADMQTRTIDRKDDLEQAVEIFLGLLQKSTFEKRDWLNDGRRAVFSEVAHAACERGMLQLMFTEIEGRPAAALFNFDYRGRIWVYNSGLDPALFSSLSPGVVLTATAIERAIQQGRTEFDFLRGNEEYKYRFGAVDTHIFRLNIALPFK